MAKDLIIQASLVDRDTRNKIKSFRKLVPDFGMAKVDLIESIIGSGSRLIDAIRYLAYISDMPDGDVEL